MIVLRRARLSAPCYGPRNRTLIEQASAPRHSRRPLAQARTPIPAPPGRLFVGLVQRTLLDGA